MDITFDIERFMEGSGRVDLTDVVWEDVPRYPLTPEALRAVRFFMITESATFYYLRGLMKTKAAMEEPEFAPFLCAWAYEEEFHGRAFAKFMQAYGEPVDAGYRGKMFNGRTAGERIDELGQAAISFVIPDDWPATHMAWGAIQEMTTYVAYGQLMDRCKHPVLELLCRRIMKQELKHFSFYYQQANKRLERSRVAQHVTSRVLKLAWTPVGDGMSSKAEVAHALSFLFDGADGDAIEQVEKRIRALPGLEWFNLLSQYVEVNGIRRPPASFFAHPRGARDEEPDRASVGV
ncbi:MAG: hypothetical protein EXR75_14820 [Myxococcales bacterium]|nr:hypothetical protein [Myxococcales bacterium]